MFRNVTRRYASALAEEQVPVDLTPSERRVLIGGRDMWGGPARMPISVARALWFRQQRELRPGAPAGGDWAIVTGIDDHAMLDSIRSTQEKLAWVRPWPEPYARRDHTG